MEKSLLERGYKKYPKTLRADEWLLHKPVRSADGRVRYFVDFSFFYARDEKLWSASLRSNYQGAAICIETWNWQRGLSVEQIIATTEELFEKAFVELSLESYDSIGEDSPASNN